MSLGFTMGALSSPSALGDSRALGLLDHFPQSGQPDPLETDENLNNRRLESLMVDGLSIGFWPHEQVLEGEIEL